MAGRKGQEVTAPDSWIAAALGLFTLLGSSPNRTYVPLRAGRYLHVHGVVTYDEARRVRDGANATGGGDTAKTCETSQAHGRFSTGPPETGKRTPPKTDPKPGSRAGVGAGRFSSHG